MDFILDKEGNKYLTRIWEKVIGPGREWDREGQSGKDKRRWWESGILDMQHTGNMMLMVAGLGGTSITGEELECLGRMVQVDVEVTKTVEKQRAQSDYVPGAQFFEE